MSEKYYCVDGNSSYKRCKCTNCRARAAKHMRAYRRRLAQRSYGYEDPQDLLDVTEAKNAVAEAHNVHGISLREIAEVVGVGQNAIGNMHRGKTQRVRRYLHDEILKYYGPDTYGSVRKITRGRRIDRQQFQWQLECLFAQGWTKETLDAVLEEHRGVNSVVRHMSNRNRTQVTGETGAHLAWLIDFIGDRHGPSAINKHRMRARGIYPLIHYTEDGKLIRKSVPELRRPHVKKVRVQSNNGAASSSGNRSAA